MKKIDNRGFTLIELLTVMLIIAILASLILGVHGYVQAKSSRARAEGEIQGISAAIGAYQADNGSVPRLAYPGSSLDANAGTEGAVSGSPGSLTQASPPVNPITNGDPTSTAYQYASRYLYGQLSGDINYDGAHQSTEPTSYMTFRPDQLAKTSSTATLGTGAAVITYLQDPYGNSYGYSTAAATDEECYQQNLAVVATTKRPTTITGFNSTFDLWSTGGRVNTTIPTGPAGSATDPNTVWARWVKNW